MGWAKRPLEILEWVDGLGEVGKARPVMLRASMAHAEARRTRKKPGNFYNVNPGSAFRSSSSYCLTRVL